MRKILYVDMDSVLVDFESGIAQLEEGTRREYKDKLDEVPGIFATMEPVDEAIEAYQRLATVFDTYILSTAPWENPSAWRDKHEWVKRHLGETVKKRLILTHHKNLNTGDFLVDDRPNNGTREFSGEWIKFGEPPYQDWAVVERYLMTKV